MKVDTDDLTVDELPRDDVLRAFSAAMSIEGKDLKTVRQDECGTEIHLNEYGHETLYGWQVGLVTNAAPLSTRNFRAMHVSNVASRAGQVGCWPCMNKRSICDADRIDRLLR